MNTHGKSGGASEWIGLPPWSSADDSERGRWFADRLCVRLGWLLWIVVGAVLCVIVAQHPIGTGVTGYYRDAATAWWAGRDLYTPGQDGWLYPPQSALLYSPFLLGPVWLGEVAYRVVGLCVLAAGCWTLSRRLSRRTWNAPFLLVSMVTLAVGGGAVLNGQANLPLAACMMLACAAIASERWWAAAVWLSLCVTIKPPGIVMPMLAAALYPALLWRLAVAGLAVVLMPWLCSVTDLAYASSQYRAGIAKVLEAGAPMVHPRPFAEIQSVLGFFGVVPDSRGLTVIRGVFALATFALGLTARRTLSSTVASIVIWALAASYLMVFNPRSEGVGYVVVAPAIALFSVWWLGTRGSRAAWPWIGAAFLAAATVMSFVHELQSQSKDFVFRPLVTLVFWCTLGTALLVPRIRATGLESSPPAR